jgi:hypothetical protein
MINCVASTESQKGNDVTWSCSGLGLSGVEERSEWRWTRGAWDPNIWLLVHIKVFTITTSQACEQLRCYPDHKLSCFSWFLEVHYIHQIITISSFVRLQIAPMRQTSYMQTDVSWYRSCKVVVSIITLMRSALFITSVVVSMFLTY